VSRRVASRRYKLLSRAAVLFGVVAAVALAVHPREPAPDPHGTDELRQQLRMDAQAAAIFSHSCADCHSNHTRWPWYSYIPPVYLLIKRDVDKGREDFNASVWSSYDVAGKREILASVARVVTNREMPLKQYLLIHRSARLSDSEGEVLVHWAGRQRRQLAETGVNASGIHSVPKQAGR
jgi:hypothetical protein